MSGKNDGKGFIKTRNNLYPKKTMKKGLLGQKTLVCLKLTPNIKG